MLFMRHVFDPHRPIEVKRMAVKLVAREGRKDAKANSKGEGGVGPSGSLVPCPPPPATATSVDVDAQNRKNEEISVQVKSKMPDGVIDFDADCEKDPFQVGIYAEDIFAYNKRLLIITDLWFGYLLQRISQDSLNLSTVRNVNGESSSGQPSRTQGGTASPYSRSKRLKEQQQYQVAATSAAAGGNASQLGNVRNGGGDQEVVRIKLSPEDSSETAFRPERRPGKYFPKILVTPQSRSVYPSPSPSITSVNSNVKNGRARNGNGPTPASNIVSDS
jgi:hypothetical protein